MHIRRYFTAALCWAASVYSERAYAQGAEAPQAGDATEAPGAPAPVASAPIPATANSIQFGLGFRYGIDLNGDDLNPWGAGLGLEGGYTLPSAWYVGASFEYFFGNSMNVEGAKLSGNVWQLSAEAGYDIGIGPNFVLRPKAGVGFAGVRAKLCVDGADCMSNSETKPALIPGATLIVKTDKFSFDLDVRSAFVFSDPVGKSLILSGGVGF